MASSDVAQSLFSGGSRPDNGPMPYAWRAYRCLDRSHFVRDAEVRRELDAWSSRLPPKAAAQIAQRFQSDDDTEHLGAFLELYVHEVGLRMGAEVDIDVGNDEADERRPDFLLRWGDLEVYVEATAVEGDDVHTKQHKLNLDKVHDAINDVIAPRFFVNVSVLRSMPSTPPLRRLTGNVQRWLDGLDPDVVRANAHRYPDYPHKTVVELGGWVIQLEAFATEDDGHDFPHHRVIGARFDGVGSIDDLAPLRRKFKKKATHYGQLGKPFVLVVLPAGTFVDDRDIEYALLGPIGYHYDLQQQRTVGERQRNGAWMRNHGPVNTRLSGVLTIAGLSPGAVCSVEPTYWPNPWAEHPMPHPGPWRRIEAAPTGQAVEHDRTRAIADVLGLSERWPAVPRG